jgi:hypothetical protein
VSTITLAYTESGTEYSQNFDMLSIRGLDDVDEVRIVGTQHFYLNGSVEEQIKGFQRIATLDFGVVHSFADRAFLYNFVRNPDRQIRYQGDVLFAALGG